MKIQNFPDIDLPTVMVSASLPGASPSQLENDVARKIENSVATLQGVKHITTKIQDGLVSLMIEFRLEKDTQEAVDDVRSAVSRVRADLPGELRDPVINKLDLTGAPILAYTIRSDQMDEEELSWFVDNNITRKLLGVKGVGAVTRVGGVTREVQVELNAARLLAYGITAADVSRQLKATQLESAGGRANFGTIEQPLRTLATVGNADELRRFPLAVSGGRTLVLGDVADIRDTVAERRSAALLNGKPVVGFEITRSRGAGEIEVGQGVKAALTELLAQRPDVELTEAFDFVTTFSEKPR